MIGASNEQKDMAYFVDGLWVNYIKPKIEAEFPNMLLYYQATIISNNKDGTLTVQSPYEAEKTINRTVELIDAEAGKEVLVVRFGSGNAMMNDVAMFVYDEYGSLSFTAVEEE